MAVRPGWDDAPSWWQRVLAGDGGELVAGRTAGAERYLVLPRRSRPRHVVDSGSIAGLSDLLQRTAVRRGVPASGSVVSTAGQLLRLVAPSWSVVTEPGQPTLREHLTEILGADITLAIVVGPPRVNRKPVVRCYAGTDLRAVAKLGPDPHTAAMVQNEAEWLQRLDAHPIPNLGTPGLIHQGFYGSSSLLVMSPLPAVSAHGVEFDRMPSSLLEHFTGRYRTDRPLRQSRWLSALADRFAPVDDQLLRVALDAIIDSDVELDLEAWHGDWSPWNLGQSASGGWYLWDWERAGLEVPRGFDAVHRNHHYGPGIAGARVELGTMGLSPPQIDATVGLYLLELAARTVEACEWSTAGAGIRNELNRVLRALGAPVEGAS